jgi:glycosyltransferase involved in cell wall biosynthesis
VLAHDVPEHREVVGDAGRFFAYRDPEDLARHLRALLADRAEVDRLRRLAGERVEAYYSWDAVTDQYEAYFAELMAR